MDTAVSVELFVEILNRYVYYFDQENEAVSFPFLLLASFPFIPFPLFCLGEDEKGRLRYSLDFHG